MKSVPVLLLLTMLMGHAAAQDVPRIDVAKSCRAAAQSGFSLSETYDSCMRSEDDARQKLASQWNGFAAADRSVCHSLTTTGSPGTYTELLTCLEMKRDARELPAASTVGRGTQPRE